jgi:hypothetical protein
MKTMKIIFDAPQKYASPAVEILEVEVEKGFENSSPDTPTGPGDEDGF